MRELDWPKPPKWMEAASCATIGTDLWFSHEGPSTRAAIKVCQACPVQAECADFAAENDEDWGIWGGKSYRRKYHNRDWDHEDAA